MKLARNIKKMIFKEKNFLYKVIFYQILMRNLENLHKTKEKPYSNLHFKYHDHSFLK